MPVGSLKALFTALQTSALLTAAGVSVLFGEEQLDTYDTVPPRIVMVPVGGPWEMPGYYEGADPDLQMTATTQEACDLYVYGASTISPDPIDQADAVEQVRALLMNALQQQQMTTDDTGARAGGLKWRPTDGVWFTANGSPDDEVAQYGRVYRLTVVFDISIPGISPEDATVTTVQTNVALTPPA